MFSLNKNHMGSLRVISRNNSGSQNVFWEQTDAQSSDQDTWLMGEIRLDLSSAMTLEFEATRGKRHQGDIALDNIVLKQCHDQTASDVTTQTIPSGITCLLLTPCLNGGTCSDIAYNQDYFCMCEVGFKGRNCEIPITTTTTSPPIARDTVCSLLRPCKHGGICIDVDGGQGFQCNCQGTGFQGKKCENQITTPRPTTNRPRDTVCSLLLPCKNGGVCLDTDGGQGFFCNCQGTGFTGKKCEDVITTSTTTTTTAPPPEPDPPACSVENRCLNRGKCVNINNGADYFCNCFGTGYTGKHCDVLDVRVTRPYTTQKPSSIKSVFKCSFEDSQNPTCGLTEETSLRFSRQSGETPSSGTGPMRAYDGSHYLFLEATDVNAGANAILSLVVTSYSGVYCLSFYYHMYAESPDHMGSLHVLILDFSSQRKIIWTRNNIQSRNKETWNHAVLNIDLTDCSKLGFEAVRGNDYQSDIALDEITLTECHDQQANTDITTEQIPAVQPQSACSPTSPCLHGGRCVDIQAGSDYLCDCSNTGYRGRNCDSEIVTPEPMKVCSMLYPCQNGGSCVDIDNGSDYFCNCGPYYEGRNCEQARTTRVLSSTSTSTTKFPVFQRSVCEIMTPCVNGGTCFDLEETAGALSEGNGEGSGYFCDCLGTGYQGKHCEYVLDCNIAMNLCEYDFISHYDKLVARFSAFQNNEPVCQDVDKAIDDVEECLQAFAVEHAECSDEVTRKISSFEEFFFTEVYLAYCQGDDNNACNPNICRNGGICIGLNDGNNFICECEGTGYEGRVCEIASNTEYHFRCSFEVTDLNGEWCGTEQALPPADIFDWSRGTGATWSNPTGPEMAQDQNYYIYLEASGKQMGDNAILYLPAVDRNGAFCLTFYYHMFGLHIQNFTVSTLYPDMSLVQNWTKSKDQGNMWHRAKMILYLLQGSRVALIGDVNGHTGDIAVDNITLETGIKPSECTETGVEISP